MQTNSKYKSDLPGMRNRLRQARAVLHMTQTEFSAATGIPMPTLSEYEVGKRGSLPGAPALAKYLEAGISVDWLLCGVNKTPCSAQDLNDFIQSF